MNWSCVLEILKPIGSVVGTVGGFLGALTYIKSLRSPKANLRFANGKKEVTLYPHYIRKASKTKYFKCSNTDVRDYKKYSDIITNYSDEHRNEKFLSLAFRLSNTGKLQLEDYRIDIDCRNGVKTFFAPLDFSFLSSWGEKKPQDLIINSDGKPNAKYSPEDGSPLNQKDYRDFKFFICPDPEADKAVLVWKIIAKDFYKEGKFVIRLKPKITEFDNIQLVYNEEQIPEGAEKIEDLTPYIEKLKKKLEEN